MFEDVYGMLLLLAATLTQNMADLGTWLSGLVKVHPVIAEVLVFVTIMTLIAWGFTAFQRRRRRNFNVYRGRYMTKEEREHAVARLMSDSVSEVIDRLQYEGKINALEAHRYYNRLGHVSGLDLPDLLKVRVPLSDEEMAQLKKRQAKNLNRTMSEPVVNIPGPKPGEQEVVIQPKKAGGWAERFLSRKAKTA